MVQLFELLLKITLKSETNVPLIFEVSRAPADAPAIGLKCRVVPLFTNTGVHALRNMYI